MPTVHPTAVIDGDVQLAADVTIGPHCVLDGTSGPIRIGSGTKLRGNVYLTGPLIIGQRNTLYPFACIGFAPQDLKWDPDRAGAGVVIGDDNTFRESVTIHRATRDDTPTTIGNDNYFMAGSHAGHDCQIANNCIFANATLLAGFVRVDDRVITGGGSAVHQFCRVGRGTMLGGTSAIVQDLPPYFMLTGLNVAGSVNLIGLRRSGASKETIEDVRWVYKTLYRSGLSMTSALERLRERHERENRPMIQEYIDFIATSKRGICPGSGKAARGTAGVASGGAED